MSAASRSLKAFWVRGSSSWSRKLFTTGIPENGKSPVPFLRVVVSAVVHVGHVLVGHVLVGHVLAAHALPVVHRSVRNDLNLPLAGPFHLPPGSLSAEGLVHGGAHAHFPAVRPPDDQELSSPDPPQISPLRLFRKVIQLRLWRANFLSPNDPTAANVSGGQTLA
ncbi:hypothetical protein CesoFtcFv8_006882 [Champsocephalus esox]|uniref:Uncharacterized protein n=1 Tax=Champsocephalus esox TaxID=159716 RepID=A0AAN8H3X7_9TELE|nr:hypothetical protein CesoFtcFv8_006882 [Champsocephalus esox]